MLQLCILANVKRNFESCNSILLQRHVFASFLALPGYPISMILDASRGVRVSVCAAVPGSSKPAS